MQREGAGKEGRNTGAAPRLSSGCSERFQREMAKNAGIKNELFSRATQPLKRLKRPRRTNCMCR